MLVPAGSRWDADTVTETHYIQNVTQAYPLSGSDVARAHLTLREFFQTAVTLEYQLPMNHWDPREDDSLSEIHACQELLLHVRYDFTNRGCIEVLSWCVRARCCGFSVMLAPCVSVVGCVVR